jgi:hypothetical protein
MSVGRFHPRGRRARVPSGLTSARSRHSVSQKETFASRATTSNGLPATNARPPPSCVGPNSASVRRQRPRRRLRQLSGGAPAPLGLEPGINRHFEPAVAVQLPQPGVSANRDATQRTAVRDRA